MTTVGIICEYNPLHEGHSNHIKKTKYALGQDSSIVCVMSGNFVQRGDFAVFNKFARAKTAILCGADLVLELPSPYALSSAEGFAQAGVHILDSLGLCDYLSFGSESGDIGELDKAAKAIVTEQAEMLTRQWLNKGLSYAQARQKAADIVLGERSQLLKSPNNLLAIEYLKAITTCGAQLTPITIKRTGGEHDSAEGLSASALRKALLSGGNPWGFMPEKAAEVCKEEITAGRGPVSIKRSELAILSRLRAANEFSKLPGATEGLEHRLMRYAVSEPTLDAIIEKTKTKRYAMSRIRRMLVCACLGITTMDTANPPPYIRVLAMNQTGMKILSAARKKTRLPIITKPATAKSLSGDISELFKKEAAATDFYTLSYTIEANRKGGQEWQQTPLIVL